MRLIGWNVFKEATSIGHDITEELIDYVKGLNYSNKELDIFTDCLYLLCMKEEQELESELKIWDKENRYLTSQKADDLLYLVNKSDYSEGKKNLIKKYITVFQRKNFLEDSMINLLPAFYEGTLLYFKTAIGIDVKDLTYMDEYGIIRLAFNTVNIEDRAEDKAKKLSIEDIIDYETRISAESDDVIRGVFIYKVDSSDETIIPIMDSTRIILSKIMEDVNLKSLSNMSVEKIGNINEIKDLFKELMNDKLNYRSFKLEPIGLYGHYHESSGFKINIDLDYFDSSNFDLNLVSNEKQLWNNGLLELEDDELLNKLKNSQLDLFYSQMRDLYDSLINDALVSKSIPLRRFIFHFSYNNKDYAIIEASRRIKVNSTYNHNRLGVICKLSDTGSNLSSLIKKTDEALKILENGEDAQNIKIRFQGPRMPLSIL